MEGNLDAVVALADRLARRSESRLTGDDVDEVGQGRDEEEVEELRMASPFCQGREDSYFSPQDVEIMKDAEDNKVRRISGYFCVKTAAPVLFHFTNGARENGNLTNFPFHLSLPS